MRFAYIDSHGNEVPIPSVDALALRIELGAVGPETELYDAQADHWGPAKTHEIFHTLSREVGGGDFVAPPVAPPPAAAPAPSPSKPSKPSKKAPAVKGDVKEEEDGFDLGLTLAEAPPEPTEPDAKKARGGPAEVTLDLAPSPADADAGFDVAGMGEGLELEEPASEAGGFGSGGLELETPMQFTGAGAAGGGGLELESPMSEFEPDSPPGWMDEPPSTQEEVMDFSSVSAAEDEAIVPPKEAPVRDRRVPKDRPSAPKFKRQRSLSGPIVLVMILLAIGVGGYVGWPILQARLARPEEPVRPAVVMPPLPAELLPRMHELADAAIADVVRQTDAATRPSDAPTDPPQQYLAGMYLGNASQFATVEPFWRGLGQFVDRLRSGDWEAYHDALVTRAGSAGLEAEQAALLVERADSGFVAAEEDRLRAYDDLERVVLAALDLHDFLLDNEADLAYRPAATSTVDPVLEVAPSTPALRTRLEEMIGAYTRALDVAMGSLDRATRQRLVDAMITRLQESGVR